jgi:Lon protease-like protein
MRAKSPFMQRFEELPAVLRIFPLANAVFLPGGHLPLNIFEPRYVNMVRDALRSDQLIGMIQPRDDAPPNDLFSVGCAGRIIRYEEKIDGRVELILAGLCRFEIDQELSTTRGYRLVVPSWQRFAGDFNKNSSAKAETIFAFKFALRAFIKKKEIDADWKMLDALAIEDLANSLLSYLPISPEDKQILLEAESFANRLRVFTAILEGEGRSSRVTH